MPCEDLNASASFAETGIDTNGGKLVLTSTGADLPDCTSPLNVVDRVGYGTTPVVCNETANAGAPTATTSIQRRDGVDTDNNSADFATGFAPTPCSGLAPSASTLSLGGRVVTKNGRGIPYAYVTVEGGSLPAPLTTMTASFGYYNFEGLSAGDTYFVTVNSKRYTFAIPTLTVNLDDAVSDADFIALP